MLGVATYANEFFRAAGELDAVYVPIGLGSGICGVIAIRDCWGSRPRSSAWLPKRPPAYAHSFAQGKPVATNSSATFADGIAVRNPHPDAVTIINRGAERIVQVSEDDIAEAVRLYYRTTHNLAEGAGAAPLAALMKERQAMAGKRVGLILSGGNIDMAKFANCLR